MAVAVAVVDGRGICWAATVGWVASLESVFGSESVGEACAQEQAPGKGTTGTLARHLGTMGENRDTHVGRRAAAGRQSSGGRVPGC